MERTIPKYEIGGPEKSEVKDNIRKEKKKEDETIINFRGKGTKKESSRRIPECKLHKKHHRYYIKASNGPFTKRKQIKKVLRKKYLDVYPITRNKNIKKRRITCVFSLLLHF